jgi:hypothetical protein
MNGQHNVGGSSQPHGPAAETTATGAPAPTPVTSPTTAPATPGSGGYDAGHGAHAASGWGAPDQGHRVPADGWGAPVAKLKNGSATQSWTVKRGLAVAGAAAVLAAGAGVGVYALASSSASADGATGAAGGGLVGPGSLGSAQSGPGVQGRFGGGAAPGQDGSGDFPPDGTAAMGGLSAAVHAEFVVLQGNDYVAKAEQLGVVTEVTSGALTVTSSDGFSRSYALSDDVLVTRQQGRRQQAGNSASGLTVAALVAGGTVRVVSAKNGSDYTAESVMITPTAAGGAGSAAGAGGTGNTSGPASGPGTVS